MSEVVGRLKDQHIRYRLSCIPRQSLAKKHFSWLVSDNHITACTAGIIEFDDAVGSCRLVEQVI